MNAAAHVVLTLECGLRSVETVRAGVELARVLGLGLRAVFVEPPALLEAWRLGRGDAAAVDERALGIMIRREGERARLAVEAQAARASVPMEFRVERREARQALDAAADPGDIAVLTMDLSDARTLRISSIAAALSARRVGAMFVPETKPAQRGDLLAADAGLAADETVKRLAAVYRSAVALWPAERGSAVAGPAQGGGKIGPDDGGTIDYAFGSSATRMIVLARRHLDANDLDAALARVRRHRSMLLVLAD